MRLPCTLQVPVAPCSKAVFRLPWFEPTHDTILGERFSIATRLFLYITNARFENHCRSYHTSLLLIRLCTLRDTASRIQFETCSIRLESASRRLELSGPQGVTIESRAGDISVSCLMDVKLESIAGAVSIQGRIGPSGCRV